MLVLRLLGFRGLLLLLLALGFLAVAAVIRRRWLNAAEKDEEVLRLLAMASEETAMAEHEASSAYGFPAVEERPLLQCAVCYCPTTRRCSQCKFVRYCSGKCQIAHWRQGHKDECHYIRMQSEMGSDFRGKLESSYDEERMLTDSASASACCNSEDDSSSKHTLSSDTHDRSEKHVSDGIDHNLLDSTTKTNDSEVTQSPSLANSVDCGSHANRSNMTESNHADEKVKSSLQFNNAKIAKRDSDIPATNPSIKKLTKATPLAEKLTKDTAKSKSSSLNKDEDRSRALKTKEFHATPVVASNEHRPPSIGERLVPSSKSAKADDFHTFPTKTNSVPASPEYTRNGLKTSVRKVVQQFKASKLSKCDFSSPGSEIAGKHKLIFPYELFMNLYTDDSMVLGPFGLTNCGNSCYANAVLQCLSFTRPLTSYFLQELHSKACRKKDWCFVCEFEYLIHKAREGTSPVSPIRILSKLHKIGSHLGHGKEEDAHEFLRYAVDTMQSVFLNNTGAMGSLAEESTLLGMTFGGYLLSKIKCMRCLGKSEQCERMMDLTVEIDGEIGTLEEALAQFTATETLDRDNKYHCTRCKSYEGARKKLTLLEAPNILTIVLKRFKSGNFEKLSKSVRFPEVLDIAPYMSSRASGRPPLYSLYAVVVHLDIMNAAFSGHYVCYVKNIQGKWFKINDSLVRPVDIETVLSEGAYMLLYARRSPRPPAMLGGDMAMSGGKPKKRNTVEAVGKLKSKPNHPSTPTSEPCVWRRVRGADSSSESSSIFSRSDASSSSTVSTGTDDFSDYICGDRRYSRWPVTDSEEWEFEREEKPASLYADSSSRQRRKSTSSSETYRFLWANPFDVRTSLSRRSAQTIL